MHTNQATHSQYEHTGQNKYISDIGAGRVYHPESSKEWVSEKIIIYLRRKFWNVSKCGKQR